MARHDFFRVGFALGLAILGIAAGPVLAVRPDIDTTGMAAIDIDVQNASAASVLRLFSEFAGVNIIAGPEVDGKITADLEDIPWLIAFDTVLRTNGYGWEQMGEDIIRVSTLEKLNNERVNEEVLERKREDFLPIETDVILVSYAKADEMKKSLETLLTGRGKIETDERTNALIVTDIASRIERVRAMALRLDKKTPQVEINAKLVDVDKRSIRDLGITWDLTGLNEGDASADFSVTAPTANPVGVVDFSLIGTDADLTATLDMLEREDKAHIISNPRITTADNKEAMILVGKKIPLVVSDEAGNAITELTTIGIKMSVTPHVNQDNRITLDLRPEVSDLSAQATVQGGIVIVTSEARTRVIVDNGQTAVIGGLVRTNESSVESGVPFLMDVPLLGYLFRSTNNVKEERELLIFVTPTIVGDMSEG
ncbi:MAG: secretin N-terminal domain-containing protein [Candidatus Eiseniibacteriota bacterium]